jgi:hypothetical protein
MNNRAWLLALALATSWPLAHAADTPTTTSQTFAQSALLGLQIAVKRGLATGKISEATANCLAELKADSLTPVFDALLAKELTGEEQQATEKFLNTPTGTKFLKYGLLKTYDALGEKAPEPLPVFSPAETDELRRFSETPAGDKLFVRKVLQMPANAAPLEQRIKELIAQCKGG